MSSDGSGVAHEDSQDMACREFVELVTDYLEEALDPGTRARFVAHLQECPGCEDYLRQMQETARLVGAVSTDSLSPEARATLLDAFRDFVR